jgi:hypothetical protein
VVRKNLFPVIGVFIIALFAITNSAQAGLWGEYNSDRFNPKIEDFEDDFDDLKIVLSRYLKDGDESERFQRKNERDRSHFEWKLRQSIDKYADKEEKYFRRITSSYENGNISSGATHAPEPATFLLLGAGLAGIAGFGRKKLKK